VSAVAASRHHAVNSGSIVAHLAEGAVWRLTLASAACPRSLRLFPSALSPHSMASGVGYGSGFDR